MTKRTYRNRPYLSGKEVTKLVLKKLTANDLIYGYTNGIFPMADKDDTLYWYAPNPRAIIPIADYKVQKSLRPVLNAHKFEIRMDTDFEGVIRACSFPRTDVDESWISEEIIEAYTDLHKLGMAHSVETYQDGRLVGGLYGVSIGAAFFGESMFHHVSNASKVAFHVLISLLKKNNFQLLDTQFINDNVKRFGAIEISKYEYIVLLKRAIAVKTHFAAMSFENLL